MPIIEKCGRSGVELHEIRRNVNANGDDTTSRGKPNNAYTDGKRKGGASPLKGFDCNRPRSCGVGMGPLVVEMAAKGLSRIEKTFLIIIHSGGSPPFKKSLEVIKALCKKGLIEKGKHGWEHTYEGDQVVRKLLSK